VARFLGPAAFPGDAARLRAVAADNDATEEVCDLLDRLPEDRTYESVREVLEETGRRYWWVKVAGPPRLSLADRGITFATTTRAGACIRFREPVPAALPTALLRHPAATVTVAEPERFAAELRAAIAETAMAGRARGAEGPMPGPSA